MKRLLFIVFIALFLPVSTYAGNLSGVVMTGASQQDTQDGSPPSCPSATYMFAWTGHMGNGDTACFNNGATNAAADTTEGTYTIDTDTGAITIDNNDERFTHDASGDDIISDTQGTVWLSIKCSAGNDNRVPFESVYDGNNKITLRITGGELLRGDHVGNYSGGGSAGTVTTTSTVCDGTFQRVAYSWQTGADAGGQHAIYAAESWEDEDVEDLDAWSNDPDDVTVGENLAGLTFDEEIQVRDVYITSGYKDTDPAP